MSVKVLPSSPTSVLRPELKIKLNRRDENTSSVETAHQSPLDIPPHSKCALYAPKAFSIFDEAFRLSREIGNLQQDELDDASEKLKQLTAEIQEIVKASEKDKEVGAFWDYVNSALTLVTSSGLVIAGTSLLSTGIATNIGLGLITAGLFGATSEVISHYQGWEEVAKKITDDPEKQKGLVIAFELSSNLSVTIASIGMGTAGLQFRTQLMNQMTKLIQVSMAGLQVFSASGKSLSDIRLLRKEMELLKKETDEEKFRFDISRLSKEVQRNIKRLNADFHRLSEYVENIIQQYEMVSRL